jgi:hypothetical protein
MCRIHLRSGADKRSLQTLALALVLAVVLAIWTIGMGKYLTADVPSEPLTNTRSLGR